MASPSERPKKDGIRFDGVFPEGHKFAGETCNALLLEKDPELGVGARCGRCGKFHTLDELLHHKIEGVQLDSAAHNQIQPPAQRKQGDGKMKTKIPTKMSLWKDEALLHKRQVERQRAKYPDESPDDLDSIIRLLEWLKTTAFDIDRFEKILGVDTGNVFSTKFFDESPVNFYLYIESSHLRYIVVSVYPVINKLSFVVRERVDDDTVFAVEDIEIKEIVYSKRDSFHGGRLTPLPTIIIRGTMFGLPVRAELDKQFFGLFEDADSAFDPRVEIRLDLRPKRNDDYR